MKQRLSQPRHKSQLFKDEIPLPTSINKKGEQNLSNSIENNRYENVKINTRQLQEQMMITQKMKQNGNYSFPKLQRCDNLPKLNRKWNMTFKFDIQSNANDDQVSNNLIVKSQKKKHKKRKYQAEINTDSKANNNGINGYYQNNIPKQLQQNGYSSIELSQKKGNYQCELKNKVAVLKYINQKIKKNNRHNPQKYFNNSPLKILQSRKSKQISKQLKDKINRVNYDQQLININQVSERLAKIYSRRAPFMFNQISQEQLNKSNLLKHQYLILDSLSKRKHKLSKKNTEELMIKLNDILRAFTTNPSVSSRSLSKSHKIGGKNGQNFDESVEDAGELKRLQKKMGDKMKKMRKSIDNLNINKIKY